MTAAMKKVLSPISEARMTPHDLKNPSKNRFDIFEGLPERERRYYTVKS